MVDINGLSCYIHTELDCCETGDNPSLKVLMKNWKSEKKRWAQLEKRADQGAKQYCTDDADLIACIQADVWVHG